MKKLWFLLAMLVCVLASCSDGGGNETPAPTPEETKVEITLDSSVQNNGLSFGTSQGESSVSFKTTADWSLTVASTTSGATWCTPSTTSGSKGSASVKFTVTENTDYEDRSVSVTIKSGSVSKTFTITQKGADALLVTTDKYEVAQEGGQIEIEVKANIDYQMEISEAAKSWIAEASSRALTTHKHTLDIAANEDVEKREGEITFKSGDKVGTVKVYQAGGAIILLSQDEYTVSDAGETISVDIKSNVEYGVQMPDVDWITDEASSRGMSSHTLKYTVAANETYDSRSADIIFYDKNSDLKDTLKVVQAQKDAIVISEKNISIAKEGGTIEVKVNTNVDFEVQIPSDATWISLTSSRTLTEKSVYLQVAKNTDEENRSTEIIITNKDSQLSETIIVTQQGNKTTKLAYCINEKELEGWSSGLFDGEGTYIMGKTYGDNGYLMTIGNILDNESAIIYMDASKQLREVFINNTIITLGEYINGGINVSIFENGGVEIVEHIIYNSLNESRSLNDHSQLVGMINLMSNLDGMLGAVNEMVKAKNFSKKDAIMFLANKTDAIRNTVLALGGPDIFNDTFSTWLGNGMNVVSLKELSALYGKAGTLGPAGACIFAYTGLYTTYLELFDERIKAYYGNSIAEIENIEYLNNGPNVNLKVSGYEPRYNLECGVIVKSSNLSFAPPAVKFPSDVDSQTVTQNGSYSFSVSDIEENKSYWCYPFLISKSGDSLWKGFIGDMAGPLVRYGKAVKYHPYNIVGKWEDGCNPPCTFIFKEDGSGSHYSEDDYEYDFNWKLQDYNTLIIERDGKDIDTLEIEWVNSNKFIYEVEYTRVHL